MLTLARHVTLPSQILSGGELGLDLTQMAALFGTAAVVYVIVRDRMVDSGLVTSRILGYGAVLLAVLVGFWIAKLGLCGKSRRISICNPARNFRRGRGRLLVQRFSRCFEARSRSRRSMLRLRR